ncbi:MAG TPA: c-type cytochrome [Polyangiaceae bacterium]|nr:c-type cytochrome [Polyangiaceae bacterium]
MSHRSWPLLLLCIFVFAGCHEKVATDTSDPSASAAVTAATNASSPTGANDPKLLDGAALYGRYCALCHGAEGQGYAADNAPSLVSQTFLESANDIYLASAIRLGRPGTAMAGYAAARGGPLSEQQVRALVGFLRSKGKVALKPLATSTLNGDAAKGAEIYQAQCVTCHGTEQARATAVWLFNPELLRSASSLYLRHAITYGRPPTPMRAFGESLGAQGVEDVIAYLRSKVPIVEGAEPEVDLDALAKLPVVINPKGAAPKFSLRDERFVPIEQVKLALEKKNKLIIIDARSPSDFIRAHIPGAIANAYYDKAGLDRIKNDGTWVLAYCACPHHASGEVIDELRRRGFKRTAVLDEGILEWQHRGYPIAGQVLSAVPAPPPMSSSSSSNSVRPVPSAAPTATSK